MSSLYIIENLVHFYGKHQALNMLHTPQLEIQQGEVLALTGANGAGKSTLLRILAFLENPSQGKIHFYGSVSTNSSQKRHALKSSEARLATTLLLQEPYVFKQSVLDNVCYGLRLRYNSWYNTQKMQDKAKIALADVGFEDEALLKRPWFQLSGGEKQRVALASRLVLDPLALLLDEPTAHVDGKSALAIHNAVQKVAENGTTVIVASHDMAWLESLSPKFLHLKS